MGALSLAGSVIVASGICAKTIQASALLNVPTCDQTGAEFFVLLILGIVFLVVGGVVLRKGRERDVNQFDQRQESSATLLTKPTVNAKPDSGMRGSFQLDETTIDKQVEKSSSGVFILGYKKDRTFYICFVGRSDTDVKAQLKQYIGHEQYDRFKFEYCNSPEAAFTKECELYHGFRGPEGKLDNKDHPTRPIGTMWSCPRCNAFVSNGAAQAKNQFCANCGSAIPISSKFCPSCGTQSV